MDIFSKTQTPQKDFGAVDSIQIKKNEAEFPIIKKLWTIFWRFCPFAIIEIAPPSSWFESKKSRSQGRAYIIVVGGDI